MIAELLGESRAASEAAQHAARNALAETDTDRKRELLARAEQLASEAARCAWRAVEAIRGERQS